MATRSIRREMSTGDDETADRVDDLWTAATTTLAGCGGDPCGRLAVAVSALDAVWDRQIFRPAATFGGFETGYGRALSAAILAGRTELTSEDERLLDAFLQHFDTRLDVAGRLLSLRRDLETSSSGLQKAPELGALLRALSR